jgi:tRNA pseudouridine55 synthase
LNGVLAIDKPENYTSFDVVARLRGILKMRKIGHGGTLDPMATGVLPVFLGKSTRAVDLTDERKRYLAEVLFGIKTDTGDVSGDILKRCDIFPAREIIENAIFEFKGKIRQIPPMYSAVKIDGRRLYEIAREGKTVARKAREIEIFEIELIEYRKDERIILLDISCSKGTYVRTLAEDIAERTGSVATLSKLKRTYSGGFNIEDCISLDELEEIIKRGEKPPLLCVDRLLLKYNEIHLSAEDKTRFLNGARIVTEQSFPDGDILRAYCDGEFLGLVKVKSRSLLKFKQFV